MKKLTIILLTLAVFSCSKAKIEYEYPTDPETARKSRAGKFFGDDIMIYGQKPLADKSQNQAQNQTPNKLFTSARDVVNSVIEIDVEDPELGVISTKWQENKTKKERTKITVLIKGAEVKEENIDIAIHKKSLDENNVWQNKSSNEELLIKLLKEKIIARAK